MSHCIVCCNAWVPSTRRPRICDDCAEDRAFAFRLDYDRMTEAELYAEGCEMLGLNEDDV